MNDPESPRSWKSAVGCLLILVLLLLCEAVTMAWIVSLVS